MTKQCVILLITHILILVPWVTYVESHQVYTLLWEVHHEKKGNIFKIEVLIKGISEEVGL